ncbi:AMP-binding protein [Streptomyces sp. DG1A-41]|uniref:AMP-binding protein n=1 Tax=Streptomyces sp. DG1A-41 TaxID=3125779 RepID=UPI0030D11D85
MSVHSPVTGQHAGTQRQGLGALRAPAVADGAFHVAAGCGEGAAVCDAEGRGGDVVGVVKGAGRLQQRDEGRGAGGQVVFVFAPADEAVREPYVGGGVHRARFRPRVRAHPGRRAARPDLAGTRGPHPRAVRCGPGARLRTGPPALRAVGVGPGRRVAVAVQRSVEQVVTLAAIVAAGGAYVPLDLAYPDERLEYITTGTGPPKEHRPA